jgi:hypothetical protein
MTDTQTSTESGGTEDPSVEKQPKVEILPKGPNTGRTWEDHTYYEGVLIAARKGSSLGANSTGPLWILEIVHEEEVLNGKIIRTFEDPGTDIEPGNPEDHTPRLWFQIQKMLRPDRVRIDVAVNLRRSRPD